MSKSSIIYTGVNGAGLCLYILFVRVIQRQIQMEERSSDFGDNMNFLFTAFPVLVAAIIWNGVWAVGALGKVFDGRGYGLAGWCVVSVLVWVAAVRFLPQLG